MGERWGIQLHGHQRMKQTIQGDEILGAEWKAGLTEAAEIVHKSMEGRVPVATGKAKATIRHRLQAKPVPMWARVGISPKTKKGFRVMGALEGGGMYHYRGTSKQGQKTKGWWSGSLTEAQARVKEILSRVGQRIEARWGRL